MDNVESKNNLETIIDESSNKPNDLGKNTPSEKDRQIWVCFGAQIVPLK